MKKAELIKMGVKELQREMEKRGNNYFGYTRDMMIQSIIDTDIARSMSLGELAKKVMVDIP